MTSKLYDFAAKLHPVLSILKPYGTYIRWLRCKIVQKFGIQKRLVVSPWYTSFFLQNMSYIKRMRFVHSLLTFQPTAHSCIISISFKGPFNQYVTLKKTFEPLLPPMSCFAAMNHYFCFLLPPLHNNLSMNQLSLESKGKPV